MAKNILIISSKSADYGGVEYHVLDLVKAFSSENKVFVMCPQGVLTMSYKEAGAEVLVEVPKAPYDFIFAIFVKNFCSENKIDIVHCHEIISAQGIFGAFLAGVSVRIWHVHTPFLYWNHRNILTKLVKNSLNWITNFFVANFFSTSVVALTPEIKKHRKFVELVIFKPINVIPNAVDINKFTVSVDSKFVDTYKQSLGIPRDKVIIGNMSRNSSEKGQMLLLDAFKDLNIKFPNKFFLLIAGGGELEEIYNKFCKENFNDNYLITGKFNDSAKVPLLKIMDYFVFPSLAEGFGYVLVESIACKLPVISSDIPVLKNVGGHFIYYFKSGSSIDLEKVLEGVISLDGDIRKSNVEKSFEKIQEYSFETFIKNYSKIYRL